MSEPIQAKVEVEEDLYVCGDANNGAGPMWCFGSTSLARVGDEVVAAGLEAVPGAIPLHNARWKLFHRTNKGPSRLVHTDTKDRTREPSPLGVFNDGRVFVTANPTLAPADAYSGPAEPRVYEFDVRKLDAPPKVHVTPWSEKVAFTEHSYRSFAADGVNREFICINNYGMDRAYWSLFDREGKWSARGRIAWPWGAEYAKPEPIRVCYPNVALHNRELHIFGVSDIIEPNPEWLDFKFKLTNQKWDYDFRRMFHAWSPDITKEPLRPWVEVASRETTAGQTLPCDIHLGKDGTLHTMWYERSIDTRLREKFFPTAKLTHQLNYAQVRDGKVLRRAALIESGEGVTNRDQPEWGRFHPLPDGRLTVFASVAVQGNGNHHENRILELNADGTIRSSAKVAFDHPFSARTFTATPRGGSALTPKLDLLGPVDARPDTYRYARVQVT